jgi:prepilin-type N-terminal cleavage/methylation domain-containing protein
MTFKNEKGLTLIELLITIAVIAIVAAISIPVITNVIESSRASSAGSMEAQVNAFIEKYAASGAVTFNGTDTFTGWVDLDADGVADANEAIETFTVDITQFALSNTPNGTNAGVGDPYASFPTATATVTVGGGTGGTQQATGPVAFTLIDFGTSVFVNAANQIQFQTTDLVPGTPAYNAFAALQPGDVLGVNVAGVEHSVTVSFTENFLTSYQIGISFSSAPGIYSGTVDSITIY